jgi:hypothetical protein
MRHSILPVVLLAAALGACSASADDGDARLSGVTATRGFDVSGFESVALVGPDNVIVQMGKVASVKAQGDTAILDRLDIAVRGNTLTIGRKRQDRIGFHWGKQAVTVTVILPMLSGASLAGSGDLTVDKVASPQFSASVLGSGTMKVASIQTDDMKVSIAGSGDAEFAGGTVAKADYSVIGAGNIDAAALAARTARISITGSGDVKAGVSEQADVAIRGSGDVDIIGDAKCTVSRLGSGDVRCHPTAAAAPGQ